MCHMLYTYRLYVITLSYAVYMSYTLYLYGLYATYSIPIQFICHILYAYKVYMSKGKKELWNSRDILPILFTDYELVPE